MTDSNDSDNAQASGIPNPYEEMFRMWKPMLDALGGGSGNVLQGIELDTGELGTNAKELLTVMASIFSTGMTCSIECWTRMAETNIRYLPTVADSMMKVNANDDEAGHSRAALVDVSRSWMQEINDISQQESRKFQATVEAILQEVVLADTNRVPEGAQRRHGRAID
ncbi:MAG: hypothetical protein ACU85V_04515 [Gammaproteobacteria bacterium]